MYTVCTTTPTTNKPPPLQSISLLAHFYAKGSSHTPTLVLAPLSVIDNWQSELTRYEYTLDGILWVKYFRSRPNVTIDIWFLV